MSESKFTFKKHQSLGLRLWHWSNAFVIFGLLATVLLRKTLLSWRTNSVIIEEKLTEAGHPISSDLAKEVAVTIRDPLWDWHLYLGFALFGLLAVRLLVFVLFERKTPSILTKKNLFGINSLPTPEKYRALHVVFVKFGYVIFYLITTLMAVTGVLLTFKSDFGLSKDLAGSLKSLHEFLMWFFVIFVAGHIIGIVIEENRGEKGLVSDMIHGGKRP